MKLRYYMRNGQVVDRKLCRVLTFDFYSEVQVLTKWQSYNACERFMRERWGVQPPWAKITTLTKERFAELYAQERRKGS